MNRNEIMGLVRSFSRLMTTCASALAVTFIVLGVRAAELAETVTLDGTLFANPEGTAPLLDTAVQLRIQILNPTKTCVLYEELQTINTQTTNGSFNVQVGSPTGAAKRVAGQDPGNAMRSIFQNLVAIAGRGSACAGNSYLPAAGEARHLRVTVAPSATGVAQTLSPDMLVDAVPVSKVAESLQGYTPSNFLFLGVEELNQSNAQDVFSTAKYPRLQQLLSPVAGNANKLYGANAAGTDHEFKSITGAGTVTVTHSPGGITITGAAGGGGTISGLTGDVVASGSGSVSATIQANAVTTVKVNDKAVTYAKIQDVASGKLLGRATAGAGSAEEITLGSGLSLTGTTLNTVNSGTVTNVASTNSYLTVASGSTTPQITANVGTAANTLAAGNDSRITGALQKSGGTMTGAIDMGGQDLNNAGNVSLAASKNLQLGTYGTDPSTAGWTVADKGKTWFNTTSNQVKYWDGSAVQALGVSGAGLTSLGGQSGSTQTFAAGATGTAPVISSAGNVHTLNVPLASGAGVTSGTISKTEYDTFNNKVGTGYALAGDVTGTPSATVVDRIKGKSVSAAPTTAGQVLRYTGTQFDPAFISMFDLRSTITGAQSFGGIGCTSGQTLTWIAATDNLSCTSIAIMNTQVSGLGSLATKSAVDLSTADATGTLAAARFPALTGAVTTAAGSLATTLGSNVVGSSNITDNSVDNVDLRQGVARSVIGVTGNATANVADIQGTANQVLRVDNAGTVLAFGQLNLASGAAVTGVLPAANVGTGVADNTKYLRGDGTWQTLPAGADNLGNHTATQNLNLATFQLVGNGGSGGISVASTGSVGVGTTSPSSPLSVKGNIEMIGTSQISGGSLQGVRITQGGLDFQRSNGDWGGGSVVFTPNALGGTTQIYGRSAAQLGNTTGTYVNAPFNGDLTFSTSDGSEKMRVTAGGNVGIGTTSPASLFTVGSSAASNTGVTISAAGAPYLELFRPSQSHWKFQHTNNGLAIQNSWTGAGYNSAITFDDGLGIGTTPLLSLKYAASGGYRLGVNNVAPANNFSVTGNADFSGNVGIGTTSPVDKLHVQGDLTLGTAGGTRLKFDSGNTEVKAFYNTEAEPRWLLSRGIATDEVGGVDGLGVNWNNGTSTLAQTGAAIGVPYATVRTLGFFTSNGTDLTRRMTILGNGSVGIGTSSPGYKLDVAGDINVTGNFKVNGTNIASGTMSSLNGSSVAAQTFATPGSAGTAPAWSTNTGTGVHTLNIPLASTASVTAGLISKTDYDNFNTKVGTGYSLAGDVTGTPAATVVDRIKGKVVSAAPTTVGQVLRYTGTQFDPAFISMFDLRSTITGTQAFGGVGCTSGQTLTWTAATDNLSCTNIVVGSSNITDNSIANADLRQGVARSVIGVTGNATANVADIQGTSNQVLRVDSTGTALAFGQLNLASSAAVTGVLPAGNMGTGTADNTKYLRGDGTWQTLPAGADNLGNHTATQNLNLATFKLVGNGGTAGLSIDASGNIGIGTTVPGAFLDVRMDAGTGTPTNEYGLYVNRSTSAGSAATNVYGIRINSLDYASGKSTTNAYGIFLGHNYATGSSYGIYQAGTNNNYFAGNVGVGTTSPGSLLEIASANTAATVVTVKNTDLNGRSWSLRASGSSPSLGPAGAFKIDDNTAGVNRLLIDATGNVGIGTVSPGQKLSVAGVIESTSGGIKFPDGTTQTTAAVGGGANNTILSGWPDAIYCSYPSGESSILYHSFNEANGTHYYSAPWTGGYYIIFTSAGAYSTSAGVNSTDCVTGTWTITQLYANGRAYNFAKGPAGQWLAGAGSSIYYNAGNVGLGTASPVSLLDLGTNYSNPGTYPNKISLWNGGANNYFGFGISTGSLDYFTQSQHTFYTGYNGSAGSAKVVISNSGSMGIGTTSPGGLLHLNGAMNGANRIVFTDTLGAGHQWELYPTATTFQLYDRTSSSGAYIANGSTSWSGISDRRLKKNVRTLRVLDRLRGFRAVSFDWKMNGKADVGVIAQELSHVFPELVDQGSGSSDSPVEDMTSPGVWGVRYAPLGAAALEGVKEISQRIDVVKAPLDRPSMTFGATGNVGVGTGAPAHQLDVVGTAGLSTGTAWTTASDLRLKDIHGNYPYGLEEVLQLRPVRYSYKKNNALGLPSDLEKTGFIAQEVQGVIPDAVTKRDDGYLELNVDPIHWAVVNAIKEIYRRWFVDSADKDRRIGELEKQVRKIEGENAALRNYLCAKDPGGPICH